MSTTKTKTSAKRACWLLLLMAVMSVQSLWSQEVRASITGVVSDASGAAVAGATVTVSRVDRNAPIETKTNEGGNYTTPPLDPGVYRLTVQFPGFRQYVRENIVLETQDRARIDVALAIGEVTDTVTVSDSVSLLQTETATRSQVIANKLIEEVPTQGRNPFQLAWSAAGVIKSGDFRYLRSFDTGGTSGMSINGGVNKENEILVDGITNVRPDRSVVHVPTMEQVQEFKVLTNTYDAQYGRTGGGTVSIVTKGGDNEFRGTLFHYFQAEELNANQSELRRDNKPKPPMTINVFGFQTSGPVFIPKFFDGRNKLFWTLSYEGLRQRSGDPGVANMPLDAWRTGDFSNLETTISTPTGSVTRPVTIFDPLTTTASGARTPFAGNRIPTSRIHPVATAALAFYPSPNSPGQINNYTYPSSWIANMDQWSGRLDYAVNSNHRVFFKYAQNPFEEIRSLVWGGSNVAEPSGNAPLLRNGRNWALDWTGTISPTMFFNLRAGLSRWETASGNIYGAGYSPANLGMSQALVGQFYRQQFPQLNLGTYQALGSDRVFGSSPDDTYSLQPNFNMMRGAHFMKFGAEFRRYNSNSDNPGTASGSYTFGRNWTQANANQADAESGNELATFLLGYPTSGYVDLNMAPAYQNHYYAFYFNDDWKLTNRLTVNLGFRWDYETPVVERYDRQLRGLDYNATNPLDSQVSGLDLRGVVEFAGIDGNARTAFNRDRNNFQPRIGAAFRVNDKTVIRGGYGVYYLGQHARGAATGFSQRSNVIASVDGNLTPAVNMSNPFANLPNGLLIQPVGTRDGAASFIGQNLTMNYINRPLPYSQQFSFDIQRELPGNMLFEIGYTGNMTSKLPVNVTNINAIPEQYMGRRNASGAIDNAWYNEQLPNPMVGLIPNNANLNRATIARQFTLLPFPQFGTIQLQNVPIGKQSYHGMQVKVTKRFSQGLSFIANYGVGKTLEQLSFRNNQDFNLSNPESSNLEKRSATDIDIPQRFVLTGVWEIPVGRGRAFGNDMHKVANFLVGGWSLNANYIVSKGWAFDYPNANQLAPGSAALSNQTDSMMAFDKSLWGTTALSPFELRQFPTRFGDVRAPGNHNVDASLAKFFPITERVRAQFRFEAINALNRPWFSRVQSLNVQDPNFGRLDPVQRNLPRFLKLGLVLNW